MLHPFHRIKKKSGGHVGEETDTVVERDVRTVALHATLWTILGLVFVLSFIFVVRGAVIGFDDIGSKIAALSCILSAIAGATLFVTVRFAVAQAQYRLGYQDGYADGRKAGGMVPDVLPFPLESRDRI